MRACGQASWFDTIWKWVAEEVTSCLGRLCKPGLRRLGWLPRAALGLGVATFGASAAPGDLDTAFDPNVIGTVVYAAVVQPDGKIVIGGDFTSLDGTNRNCFARLNADGSLDPGFDPNADATVYSSVLQADGKILIGGQFTSVGAVAEVRNRIARLNADGTLDAGFDPNANNNVNAMAMQTNGQIVIGGSFITVGGTNCNRIARLNADGTLDTGFNPNANSFVNTIAVQTNGQFIIGGNFTTVAGTNRSRIARLNADGTLDTGFNPDANSQVFITAVQPDGKILIGGSFTTITNSGVPTSCSRIARLNADGTLDTAFNPGANHSVNTMVLQADGKIIIGGSFTTITNSGVPTARNRIARLNADGTLDTGFNPNADNVVYGVAIQADGQVLIMGQFTGVGVETRNGIARLMNDTATQSLTVPNASRVEWLRGGASPETDQVSFDLSTDGGTNYTPLGSGARISGGWELTGMNLPGSGQVRARARTTGGRYNGSSGLVEAVTAFSGLAVPEIAMEQPMNTNLVDGGSTDFGLVAAGGSTNLTFTIRNTGTADLTGLGITIDGTDAALFTVTASPVAPVSGPDGSTTFTVRLAPTVPGVKTAALHIANNDYDENPFDLTLTGTAPGLPTISDLPNQTINEDGNTGPLAFTIGDGETAVTNLALTRSSSNPTLVPNTNIVFGGSGSNRTVTVTPVANESGSATITITVTDGDSLTASDSFTLTVLSVNDVPSFTKGTNLVVNENAGPQTVAGWATAITAGPPAESGQLVDFILSNDNNALFSVQPAIAANGTLTYTAVTNANGAATVTARIHDNGGTANGGVDTSAAQTFTIMVNAVNYAPSGANNAVTTLEDTAYTFSPADFGFSDPNDFPTNAFTRVKITTLPFLGTLAVDGIAVNAGDFVAPTAPGVTIAAGASWTSSEIISYWSAVASSADGRKLVAAANNDQIYTSTDSGVSWTAQNSGSRSWKAVASSSDGSKLVAVVNGGQIYTSTDSGVTWTARASNRSWYGVASSADGSKLVAVVLGGQIYSSTDSGVTWTARETSRDWRSVASSADGSKLVAVVQDGQIHTSTDSGVSWTPRETSRSWQGVASSAAGDKLVAVANNGQIYTSTDSGVSWTPRESIRRWYVVASSADGRKLVAAVNDGQIYTSTDSGVSWTARENNRLWRAVVTSADGSKLVAAAQWGPIYISVGSFPMVFTPATNSYGTPHTSFTFQVEDDGSTANGGANLDPSPKTMAINVPPVNDAPTLAAISPVVTMEDAGLQTVNLSGISAGGSESQNLTLTASSSNQGLIPHPSVTYSSPNETGSLSYTPVAGTSGTATITVIVTDNGGTANGGINAVTNTFTVTVTSLNDAPVGADRTITINEDTSYAFMAADFGFTDLNDSPANVFNRVKVTTLPSAGALTWNGAAVNGGDYVNIIAAGATWTTRETSRNWYAMASSSDGSKLVASVRFGQIYTSTDSGSNWTARENSRDWMAVASSADGSKLVAANYQGQLYTSTDSGATWTPRESNRSWAGVAASSDGSKLVAAVSGGQIYTSTDSGVNWTARESIRLWGPVASSADGNKLVAAVYGGQIYTSTDSGVSWTARESSRYWGSVASSSDGSKLVAVDCNNGRIYTSTDSGVSWTARATNREWQSVASSADGSKLVAVVSGVAPGQIYTSTDSGVNWTARESIRLWHAVASSADGNKLVAAVYGGQIYTSIASAQLMFTPAPNATGTPQTTFTFQVEDDGGTANGGVNLDPSPKTLTINVTPVNDPPTLAAISNPTILEDVGVQTVSLSGIGPGPDSGQSVVSVTASSSNPGLIPNPSVSYTNGNATASLSYTPVTNASGMATITVVVTDDGGVANGGVNAATITFVVTVTPVNDAPTLAAINNPLAILENAGLQMVNLSGISAGGGENQVLTLTASSSDPGLIPNPTVSYANGSPTGSLSYAPVANASGSATISVVVTDDGDVSNGGVNSATNTFTVTVAAVADDVGTVDAAFDPNAGDVVYGIAEQPDGKIIVGGNFTTIGATARNYIARLNADGTLDTGFNPNASTNVYSVAVQTNGMIVIGGQFNTVGGVTRNRIARLNPVGTLETGFNPNLNGDVRGVAVLSDGKIMIGGSFTTVGGVSRNRLARLRADGTLDTAFPDPVVNGDVVALAVQTDGSIIIGGNFTAVNGGVVRNRLARFNADGTLDNGFNPNVNNQVLGVAVQADGKIVIGGSFTNVGGINRSYAARLNINGTVDATFANPNADGWIETVAVQADRLILFGGRFTNIGGAARNRIARFSGDGALDNNFNPNASDSVLSCAVQADGRIIVGGSFSTLGGVTRNRIARLANDAVTASLTVPDSSRVRWLRGGASPETHQVAFELSTDGGTNYTYLGAGARISGGWELTGLSLPPSGTIRARGRTSGGVNNGSSGLVEATASYPSTALNSFLANVMPSPPPDRNGQLRVTLLPGDIGAQWRFAWELGWRNTGDLVTNLPAPDNYEISFRPVAGYTPLDETRLIGVAATGITEVTNQYTSDGGGGGTGWLRVDIEPNTVVSNAGWRLVGEAGWRLSGDVASGLAPGVSVVEFQPLNGWSAPAKRAVQVFANQGSVITAGYLVADPLPGGVALPTPLASFSLINDSLTNSPMLPYGFNGQLQTASGFGSGVAIREKVVLTAAHVVFDDGTLSFVSDVSWFFQKHAGEFDPKAQQVRGWYVMSSYSAARSNDLASGYYAPGQSSPQSRNSDVAALYFTGPAARGGYAGFLASEAGTNEWLASPQPKMLVGYPVDGAAFGYTNIAPGKMHQVTPANYAFTVHSNQVYTTAGFLSFPGNSGGSVFVLHTNASHPAGIYYPAGVYLGTLGTSLSLVRGIDSNVVNLINLAADLGDAGTNNTGGGVITIISGQYLQGNAYLQIVLGPAAAIAAGGGWWVPDSPEYSAGPYQQPHLVSFPNAGTHAVRFVQIPGWDLVSSMNVSVVVGQLAVVNATYIRSPMLSVNPAGGLVSGGFVGGPFAPTNITYALSNSGESPCNWSVSKTTPWLSLSVSGGALAAGASTNVTVSLNVNANGLAAGTYSDTVSFTNLTTGLGSTNFPVTLNVAVHPPVVLANPHVLTNGGLAMTLQGVTNRVYSILETTNLLQPIANWTEVLRLTNTAGQTLFTNPPPSSTSPQFYRAWEL